MDGPTATVSVIVEFEDVDSYRIAHHSKLVCYLERARLRLLKGLDLPLGPDDRVFPVMHELNVKFHRPARLLDHLDVTAELARVDEFRVVLKYRIRREGQLVARATSSIAFVDLESGAPVTVPEKLFQQFGDL
ncbi:MAG: acyl-CoA thioesterase [Deltaproteobacteria bacterium]|nr:acyl-CoA thioesterase [Deltaproteobacteria bacterium]